MDDFDGAELVVERFINNVSGSSDYSVVPADNVAYP